MKRFLLSDESRNSHGVIIRTAGINLERFLTNPVMFYNHDMEKGVIGRWENIEVSGTGLYGVPVFDEDHELGKTIKRQVEQGFLNGASIGVGNVVYGPEVGSEIPEIVSCELLEVSICDIPANMNALQLYHNDKPVDFATHRKLCFNRDMPQYGDDYRLLLEILSLPEDATMTDVLDAVNELVSRSKPNASQMLNMAYKSGVISENEQRDIMELCWDDPERLSRYLNGKRKDAHTRLSTQYDQMVKANTRKFESWPLSFVRGEMKEFALSNFNVFRKFVERLPEKRFAMEDIELANKSANPKDRTGWTLADYRKYAPQELQHNPELYKSLVKNERTRNPELRKRLIDREHNNDLY